MSRVTILTSENYKTIAPLLVGTAMSTDSIIFETEGLEQWEATNPECRDLDDGRFFAILDAGDCVRAFTDPLGQDTLFYYDDADWMVSNSFYGLAKAARTAGKKLTLRPDVLACHFIYKGNTFGSQLISAQTAFEEIKVLPLGCEIHISKADNSFSVNRVKPGDWLSQSRDGTYTELLETYVLKTCARIRALAESGYALTCDLSGGHDSRALVGMVRRSVSNPITVFSNTARSEDFISAQKLADAYGFDLSTRRALPMVGTSDEIYELWKLASLGVYLPPYQPSPWTPETAMRIHGGNFLSKEFGELSAEQRTEHFRKSFSHKPELYDAARAVFYSSFPSMGIDPKHDWAMQHHYLAHRGRFHYGRNWTGTGRVEMITPLISQHFAFAAFKTTPHEYNHLRPCLDLLLAIDNQLALIPFDSPKKCWPDEAITSSPFWRKPIGFRAHHLTLPRVYAGNSAALKRPPDYTGRSMKAHMRSDAGRLFKAALSTGIFRRAHLTQAIENLETEGPLPLKGRLAAHIIFTGECASMASAGAA